MIWCLSPPVESKNAWHPPRSATCFLAKKQVLFFVCPSRMLEMFLLYLSIQVLLLHIC
jgi:hypothetical protein